MLDILDKLQHKYGHEMLKVGMNINIDFSNAVFYIEQYRINFSGGVVETEPRSDRLFKLSPSHHDCFKLEGCYTFLSLSVDVLLREFDGGVSFYILFLDSEFFDDGIHNSKIISKFVEKTNLSINTVSNCVAEVVQTSWKLAEFQYDPRLGDMTLELRMSR